jgi:dCMP deaminase
VGYNSQTDIMNQVYLKQAYIYASNSIDPSTQNGAVLLHPLRGIVLGACNELPERIKETPDRWKRPEKYCYVEHAERNLIYKAAKKGIPTDGMVICCPWYCCTDCARAIIQAGIIKVIGHQNMFDLMSDRWKESCEKGIAMLEESGIECVYWKGKVGEDLFSIRFDGKEFYP